MVNVLLSIGCDKYDSPNLRDLNGGENDSQAIFRALVESEYALYDTTSSQVLRSPCLNEFREALQQILFQNNTPDVFTLFFAGHGGVLSGTYYLTLKDTRLDCSSMSAISLREIFQIVAESRVHHVNVIIDACQSSGLVNDLPNLLKPEIIGRKGSLGVSILAASASDESAKEVNGQGVLTSHILKYINGEKNLSTNGEYLDLATLGKEISTELIQEGGQTPTSWGFNLFGPSIFCKNPFSNPDGSISTHAFSYIPPSSKLGRQISQHTGEFWELFDTLDNNIQTERLLKLVQSILVKTETQSDITTLIKGVGFKFVRKLGEAQNFGCLEVLNVFLAALLPYSDSDETIALIRELKTEFAMMGKDCLFKLNEKINNQGYLLNEGVGLEILANYYYLPIRVSMLLGYVSQILLFDKGLESQCITFIERLVGKYFNNLTCVNDLQAPYLYVFFKALSGGSHKKLARKIHRKYFGSFVKARGCIASLNIKSENCLSFFLNRHMGKAIPHEYIANPVHLGTTLLAFAKSLENEDNVDLQLHFLDWLSFLLFIPEEVKSFGNTTMRDGENMVLRCGFSFWTTHDFLAHYEPKIENFKCSKPKITPEQLSCCIASSFIQPDRLPVML